MNWQIIFTSLRSECKFIFHNKLHIILAVAPFLIVLILKLLYFILSGNISLLTAFGTDKCYLLVSLTIIPVIPMLTGMLYELIFQYDKNIRMPQFVSVTPAVKRNLFFMRMTKNLITSFILLLVSIIIVDPVPSEGWLRILFVSSLLSIQSLLVFLLRCYRPVKRLRGIDLLLIYVMFLIAVPFGLLFSHPWSYLAFFSPLYWISWAWMIPDAPESLLYGLISLIITAGVMIILYRYSVREDK
jgi:hypothetical protein